MTSSVKIKTAQFMAVIAGSVMALTLAVVPIHALEATGAAQGDASAQILQLAQAKPSGKQANPSGKRPPREAVEACEGRVAGDACSFELPDGKTEAGTCRAPDAKAPAACAPAKAPKG